MNSYAARALLALFSLMLVFLTAEMFLRLLPDNVDSLSGLHQAEPGEPWLYSLVPDARILLPGSPRSNTRSIQTAIGARSPRSRKTRQLPGFW